MLKLAGFAATIWFVSGLWKSSREYTKNQYSAWCEIKTTALSDLDFIDNYDPNPPFPGSFYDTSPLMPRQNTHRRVARDQISGTYNGINYELIALRTSRGYRLGNRWRNRYQPVYRGLLLTIPFAKATNGDTVLTTDNTERLFGGISDSTKTLHIDDNELELIEMANARFESSFTVRTNDPAEAKLILSGEFMDRLFDVKFQLESQIQMRFNNAQICMSIPIYQEFLDARKSMGDVNDQKEKLIADVRHILSVIDALQLSDVSQKNTEHN